MSNIINMNGNNFPHEFEIIAQLMLRSRGDIGKASRSEATEHNAMALRRIVKENPSIRNRYHELLADELMDKGLHISERILKLADLQDKAYGGEFTDPETGMIEVLPADTRAAIDLSKEISRLITESKQQNISDRAASNLVSKESAIELLRRFLDGK